jgi:prepilin-type N-terminal cleavage/methylation domain-containing protein
MNNKGFTMVEVVTSLVILAVAIIGLSSTTARLAQVASGAETRALALQAVEDRISRVRLHPIYQQLDSVFSESDVEVPNMPDYTRTTTLSRILEPGERDGKYVDFTRITVSVDGPGLEEPISRTVAVGVS